MSNPKPTGYVRTIDAEERSGLLRQAQAAGRHPAPTEAREGLEQALTAP